MYVYFGYKIQYISACVPLQSFLVEHSHCPQSDSSFRVRAWRWSTTSMVWSVWRSLQLGFFFLKPSSFKDVVLSRGRKKDSLMCFFLGCVSVKHRLLARLWLHWAGNQYMSLLSSPQPSESCLSPAHTLEVRKTRRVRTQTHALLPLPKWSFWDKLLMKCNVFNYLSFH